MTGCLITFSGIDGVGKTSQVTMLGAALSKRGLRVISLYDLIPDGLWRGTGYVISDVADAYASADVVLTRMYLPSPETANLMTEIKSGMFLNTQKGLELVKRCAYSALRDSQAWWKTISDSLALGHIVILDRYYYDEIAYRSLYGVDSDWLTELYKDYRKPDLGIVLSLPPEQISTRNLERPDGRTELVNNKPVLNLLDGKFREIAQHEKLVVLDANRSMKDIHEMILSHVKSVLGEKKVD